MVYGWKRQQKKRWHIPTFHAHQYMYIYTHTICLPITNIGFKLTKTTLKHKLFSFFRVICSRLYVSVHSPYDLVVRFKAFEWMEKSFRRKKTTIYNNILAIIDTLYAIEVKLCNKSYVNEMTRIEWNKFHQNNGEVVWSIVGCDDIRKIDHECELADMNLSLEKVTWIGAIER